MSRVVLGARVTDSEAEALRAYAEGAGITFYQATVQALAAGISTLTSDLKATPTQAPPAANSAETVAGLNDTLNALRSTIEAMSDVITDLKIRAGLSEQVGQRSLYAAGAAYAAALAGPGKGEDHMAGIVQDANRIFERQLAIAQQGTGTSNGE